MTDTKLAGQVIVWDGTPIDKPGVYEMTEQQYHDDPCKVPSCSASLLKKAIPGGRKGGSMRHVKQAHPRLTPVEEQEDENSKKFDLGSVFHSELLGKGAELVIVDAKAWTKKDDKEIRDKAYAEGKQPILTGQLARVQEMVREAKWQMAAWKDLQLAMAGGAPERVLVWVEETPSGPVWCRCKLDWEPHHGVAFPDWKTTEGSASPDDYGRIMFDTQADVQDAFYRRGIKAVLGRAAYLLFAVVEVDKPHAMACHRVDPASAAMGDRKVQWAINAFGMCMARNRWPGYPNEVAWQSAPPWVESKWLDREDSGMTGEDWTLRMIDEMGGVEKRPLNLPQEFADDFGVASGAEERAMDNGV